MTNSKTLLMAAVSAAAFVPTAASAAGFAYPAATVEGNGASSIVVVLNKTERCLGAKTAIGFTDGTTVAYPDHSYTPVTPSLSNPNWDCATQQIQPSLTYKYTSTGSGGGKNDWAQFNVAAITPNNPLGTVGHIQYAFSDSAIIQANLDTYNASAAPNGVGPAIQVPFYVLPIALAYSPIYGVKNTGSGNVNLAFNVKSTFLQKDGAGNVVGGLRLKKSTYCAIMNGTIKNWNDAAIKTDNGGQSLMDAADDLNRWNTGGVPIRLVGRADNSGTTNLTSRHLAAACAGTDFSAQGKGADQLPAARKGTATYDRNTGALTAGVETAGLFGLVMGSDGIATVVGTVPAAPATAGEVALNGAFGYVGADFVRPAYAGASVPAIFSAALQQALTTTFKMPTPANATAAFGTAILPPESNSNGTFNPAVTANGHRANPLDWAQQPNDLTKLANPATGYPIVGTTNALLYTCYDSAAKRSAVVALAALQFGKLVTSASGVKFPVALVNSTAKGSNGLQIGILSQNGISNLPASWKNAIWETFFAKVVKTTTPSPASLNLYIQDKLPTSQATYDALKSNPQCTGAGA